MNILFTAPVLLLIATASALQQPQPGVLKGRVLDSVRAPVTNAVVSIRATGAPLMRVSVEAAGQFATTLQPGSYRVCVGSQGFEEMCQRAIVAAGTTTNVEVILKPAASNTAGPNVDATPHVARTLANYGEPATLPLPDMRIRVSEGILDVLAVKKVLPQPPWSQDKGHEKGVVTLTILVDYDGTVKNTSLLSGDPVLGEVAIGAIKQWQFKPYTINGQPVRVESRVMMKFNNKRASIVLSHR